MKLKQILPKRQGEIMETNNEIRKILHNIYFEGCDAERNSNHRLEDTIINDAYFKILKIMNSN